MRSSGGDFACGRHTFFKIFNSATLLATVGVGARRPQPKRRARASLPGLRDDKPRLVADASACPPVLAGEPSAVAALDEHAPYAPIPRPDRRATSSPLPAASHLPYVWPFAALGAIIIALLSYYALPLPTKLQFTFYEAMTLGAITSATDPVAALAVLKQSGASVRLSTLVAGESLMNDGTALVVFKIFWALAEGCEVRRGPLALRRSRRHALFCRMIRPPPHTPSHTCRSRRPAPSRTRSRCPPRLCPLAPSCVARAPLPPFPLGPRRGGRSTRSARASRWAPSSPSAACSAA